MPASSSNQLPQTNNIALTAFLTNYWKARANTPAYWKDQHLANGETLRQKPLYKNSRSMTLFASPETAKLLTSAMDLCRFSEDIMNSVHPVVGPYHAPRHRYHTRALKTWLQSATKPEQVVVLGAGLDTRSISKGHYPVKFFEVDLPQLIAVKTALYQQYGINPNAKLIATDYVQDDLIKSLVQAGVGLAKPTHFIWEGNVMYLPNDVVRAILLKLQQHFTAQVTISLDYYIKQFIEKKTGDAAATKMVEQMEAMGAKFTGGIDNIEAFAQAMNMQVTHHVDGAELLKEYELDTQPDPRLRFFHMATLCVRPAVEAQAIPSLVSKM